MGLQLPKLLKLVIFGINLQKRGIPPYANFIKFGLGMGVPGPHMRVKFHRFGFKKCGPTASKIAKNRNFWYKFSPKGKFRGSTEKVEYRCNDTIIVLKITLLHRVSVITNFVIPKRDKKQTDRQTDKKYHTFSSSTGARPTIPTILGMVIEEVRPIFAPPNFFDTISSFSARGY